MVMVSVSNPTTFSFQDYHLSSVITKSKIFCKILCWWSNQRWSGIFTPILNILSSLLVQTFILVVEYPYKPDFFFLHTFLEIVLLMPLVPCILHTTFKTTVFLVSFPRVIQILVHRWLWCIIVPLWCIPLPRVWIIQFCPQWSCLLYQMTLYEDSDKISGSPPPPELSSIACMILSTDGSTDGDVARWSVPILVSVPVSPSVSLSKLEKN